MEAECALMCVYAGCVSVCVRWSLNLTQLFWECRGAAHFHTVWQLDKSDLHSHTSVSALKSAIISGYVSSWTEVMYPQIVSLIRPSSPHNILQSSHLFSSLLCIATNDISLVNHSVWLHIKCKPSFSSCFEWMFNVLHLCGACQMQAFLCSS